MLDTHKIGTQVKILPTGDTDIDQYKGQIGTVIKIEPSELRRWSPWFTPVHSGDYDHYFVQMADGVEVVINSLEFEIV